MFTLHILLHLMQVKQTGISTMYYYSYNTVLGTTYMLFELFIFHLKDHTVDNNIRCTKGLRNQSL